MDARQIIDRFGYAALAAALNVPVGTVSAWKSRRSIPHFYWRKIEAEAQRLDISDVTYAALEADASRRIRRRTFIGASSQTVSA